MDDPIDRVQLDAEDRAYAGIFRRSGPYGDVPSTHAEIAGDLKGHAPSMDAIDVHDPVVGFHSLGI